MRCTNAERGNALIEFLLVPLILLPLSLAIVNFWGLQRAQICLDHTARSLNRAGALVGVLTDSDYRELAETLLGDELPSGSFTVTIRHHNGTVIELQHTVQGVVPGAVKTLKRTIAVPL